MQAAAEIQGVDKEDAAGGVVIVNFAEGEEWRANNTQTGVSYTFKVEAGGFINSEKVNGSL